VTRNTSLTWRKLALALVAASALAACNPAPSAQHPPEPGDTAVARVSGQVVWASDVKREALAEGLVGPGDPLDVSSDLFRQVLDEVIDTKVLAAEALARHLDRDPVAQRRLASARERALEDIMVDSVVGQAVNQKAENALYQDFLKHRTPSETIHLRQIVLGNEADADAARKALAGGAAFEAVAMQSSIDAATRFKGGDLGQTTTDSLPQDIAAAVAGAKAGQVVGPVRTASGWTILRVEERGPEPAPTLDEVRPQLIRFLAYDKIKDLVLTLRSKSKIETLIPPPHSAPGAPTEPASAPLVPPPGANAAVNAASNTVTE
jgi:peptidyl-prolyl cis-trans isomerase C